ncbi:cell division protein SepF [Amycolatopsis sp. OK19-0408]|uniref:Cell division protein SepF n=1 Tax=Amycolatopsis iheyensis TaxID=2945988 RepID=A0A9X2N9J4_9PSEU|nr:cell division protein SepF [Amycolatopsis iheyensis]MCR6484574.1 cell division protein SepF [Amycolatopsis iheyensis]
MLAANIALDYVRVLIWPLIAVAALILVGRFIRENTRRPKERPIPRPGVSRVGGDDTTTLTAALEDSEWLASTSGAQPPSAAVHLQQAVHIGPSSYREAARELSESLLAGRVVVLDLAGTTPDTAARLVDYCSGFTRATRTLVQQLSSTVIVLTPQVG